MDGEWQLGSFPSPFNHAADAHASEWLSTLVDEHIGGLGPFALQALEPSKFVAFEIVDAIGAAFQPTDGNGAF